MNKENAEQISKGLLGKGLKGRPLPHTGCKIVIKEGRRAKTNQRDNKNRLLPFSLRNVVNVAELHQPAAVLRVGAVKPRAGPRHEWA